jgi:hypothetical protein
MDMAEDTSRSGWVRLSSGFDVELIQGIPMRLSNNGLDTMADDAQLVEEVAELTGLTVIIDGWVASSEPGEQEARLCVDVLEFGDVLQKLALTSAAVFVDHYHVPIDPDAVDWDSAEFARDFNRAAVHCCIDAGEMNRQDYFDDYVRTMHVETQRLVKDVITPIVDAE